MRTYPLPLKTYDIQISQHRGIIIQKNEGNIRSSDSRNMHFDLLLPANPRVPQFAYATPDLANEQLVSINREPSDLAPAI